MSEADDDTLLGDTGDTIAAASQPSNPSVSGVRIRASRPSVSPVATDYAELTVVDPAHYVIGRELARGGMGRIQIAHDRRLGRDVAVKEVLVAAGSVARRFEREARITARLQHPSIISVHEAGKWPSGEPFYAMRLVTGRSLDEAIDAAKSYAQRLALLPNVLAVADAMAYAHGQKVIHRDLKPKNVIVGDFGETVVIDWGLAKELGVADDLMTSLTGMPTPTPFTESQPGETTLGEVLGTPQYMPPEQAAGEPVDERADVYAIGSILYHALAGRPPYIAESNAELIAALHAAPPLPISRFAPEVSGELVAIAERAMARDRDKRYPSAKELADDLRRFQTGQMVGAHRYSLRQLLGRWMRRNRTGLAAAAAAMLVAVTVGVVAVKRIVSAEHVAQRERETAIENGERAHDLAKFMLGDLRDKLGDAGRLDLLESVAKRVIASYDHPNAPEDEQMLATQARSLLGVSASQRGDTNGAIEMFSRGREELLALEKAHPDNATYLGRRIEMERNLAIALGRVGRRAEADKLNEDLQRETLAAVIRFPTEPVIQQNAIQTHVRSAQKLRKQHDIAGSIKELKEALAVAEHLARVDASNSDPRRTLQFIHGNLGDTYDAANDRASAIVEYKTCLGISLAAIATAPNNVFWLHRANVCDRDIADELAEEKDLDGANAVLHDALALAKRAYATDPANSDTKSALTATDEKLGDNAAARKDYDAALEHYREFATLQEELAAREPNALEHQRGRSLAYDKLGNIAAAKGDFPTAIERYKTSLGIREGLSERDRKDLDARRDLFYAHYRLARLYEKADNEPLSLGEMRTAIEIAEQNHAADPANETYAGDLITSLASMSGSEPLADGKRDLARAIDLANEMATKPHADVAHWKSLVEEIDKAWAEHEKALAAKHVPKRVQ